jgi:hypothetical protein
MSNGEGLPEFNRSAHDANINNRDLLQSVWGSENTKQEEECICFPPPSLQIKFVRLIRRNEIKKGWVNPIIYFSHSSCLNSRLKTVVRGIDSDYAAPPLICDSSGFKNTPGLHSTPINPVTPEKNLSPPSTTCNRINRFSGGKN